MEQELHQAEFYRQQDTNESPIKRYLFVALENWKWFVASLILTMIGAFLFNRYTTPEFLIGGTMVINDDKKSTSGEILKELDLFSSSVNINTEIAVLKSYNLTKKIVDSLELYTIVYKLGKLKDYELFKEHYPFTIHLISDPNKLAYHQFELRQTVDGLFIKSLNSDTEQQFFYGQTLTIDGISFTIGTKGDSTKLQDTYKIVFSNPKGVTQGLRGRLAFFQTNRDASIIAINMRSSNPEMAIGIINLLMHVYIERELALKNQTAERTIDFIDSQLSSIQDALFKTESEMENFRATNNIINISQEGETIYSNLQEFEKERQSIELKLEYYNYLLDYLKSPEQQGTMVSPSIVGISDQALAGLIGQFNQLKSDITAAQSFASEINPNIKAARDQMKVMLQSMTETIQNLINTTELTKETINRRISKAESELNALPVSERKLINIQRRFTLNDNLYVYLLQKKAEAGIAKASTVASTEVLDKPLLLARTKPQTSTNYSYALLLGVAIPFLFVFLKEFFTTTIQEASEVEKQTGLPMLSNIAFSHKETELIMSEFPRSQTAEGFRSMRAGLRYLTPEGLKCHTIMFTSYTPGDGKTFSAMNTAIMMAMSGYKTILLGLDLRRPNIFDTFGFDNQIGISKLLIDNAHSEDIILQTEIKNLDIILSGPTPPLPNELFTRQSFKDLMKQLKESYDYIIIDTPPIGLVSDAFDIGSHADTTLFVIRHQMTPRKSIEFINDITSKGLIKNIGFVYNGMDYKKLSGRIEYGYRYGSSYYDQ